jgi:Zn-dependent M28 family amino/carboxypeptidase
MEIAGALAGLNPRPQRSILFLTFFGEEEGLLGSYYYAAHPLEPLRSTVADINLEQMGRPDDPAGTNRNGILMSGLSFSDLPASLSEAAKWEGVTLRKRADSDDFFDRSDNYAFALHGVIAHTLAVAFDFPDYHRASDTADKIDYENMARVDRAVAAGVIAIADRPAPPAWSDSKAAGIYREAAGR